MNYEMDLTIEAVTGTVYDLCVSPFETILGIKTKIQKLEGIPVSQQHLIHGSTELMDDYCLEEYHIESGAQLKLVIAMRGGPIHAHRIQLEDYALMELAEYLESQSPDDQDQYAIMFLSEDNDGRSQLHSPIEVSAGSYARGSQTSLVATTKPTTAKVLPNFENDITYGKMREIQSRLKNLRLNKTEHIFLPKPKSRPPNDLLLQERSPSHYSTPYTPPPVTGCCGCHKKKCHCPCHISQRCLRFTPINDSKLSTPHEVYDKQRSARKSHEKRRRVHHVDPSYDNMWKPSKPKKYRTVKGGHVYSTSGSTSSNSSQPQSRHEHFLPPINYNVSKPKHSSLPKRESSQVDTLPPIVVPKPSVEKTKISNRCMQCHKRMRLANTFTCKCGNVYCSIHRYAESHSCTFNYKEEGKATIARNNPLVTAPKLSKI